MEFNWERNKENILPLKSGRVVSEIVNALTIENYNKVVESKIKEYEARIISSEGLFEQVNSWYNYIVWLEQTQLSNNHTLFLLIERAVQELNIDNDELLENENFMRIWLKYAYHSVNKNGVYRFMFFNNIGTVYATFYHSWAQHLESIEEYRQAKEVYTMGIHRNVEDCCKLEYNFVSFTKRLEKIQVDLEQQNSIDELLKKDDPNQNKNKRVALASLVSKNKYHEAMDRVENATQATPYQIEQTKTYTIENPKPQQIDVYTEDDTFEAEETKKASKLKGWPEPLVNDPKNNQDGADKQHNIKELNKKKSKNLVYSMKKSIQPINFESNSTINNTTINNRSLGVSTNLIYVDSELIDDNDEDFYKKQCKTRIFIFKPNSSAPTLHEKPTAKSTHFVILSPDLNFCTDQNTYSFEELIAAKYKKQFKKQQKK